MPLETISPSLGPSRRVLAVDGTGVLVRCKKAAGRTVTGLTSSDGTPTGTLMMFIGALARKLRDIQPDYAVIAWDGPGALAWRREICPDYKRDHADAPADDLEGRLAADFCLAAGLRQVMVPGFEADDLLAAVQRQVQAEMPGALLDLLSDDADVLQLLGSGLTAVHGIGFDAVITALDVEQEWHVQPEWLPRLRAMIGDPSDKLRGLPGIGPARARVMLNLGRWTWPLPEEVLGEPGRSKVAAWCSVMDLINPPRRPEDDPGVKDGYFALKGQAEWHREDPGALRIFLERYELRRLSERLSNGRLW